MTTSVTYCIILILSIAVLCNSGLFKKRRHKDDEAVETLLAVGLIAKALSENDAPSATHCPPPVQVTRVIQVPVHKERVVFLKGKDCDGGYHESKNTWATHLAQPDSVETPNWRLPDGQLIK